MRQAVALKLLRRAGLRPSAARIGVLLVLQATGVKCLSADEVYHALLLRGTHAGLGTIYRTLRQCLETGLIERELDIERLWRYRLKPVDAEPPALQLVCPTSGRVVFLNDPDLHATLLAAARGHGISLVGRTVSIAATEARKDAGGMGATELAVAGSGPAIRPT